MSDHRRGPRRDRRGAQAEVEELAERTGALLATTLPARGIFDHNPFSIDAPSKISSRVKAAE
jgi:acetolactate synthase I/II/III large subunit